MAEQAEQEAKAGQGETHPSLPADSMIILPVRQTVLFPGIVLPLAIGRKSSVAAAQEAVRSERMIGIILQTDLAVEEPTPEQLHRVGTAAQVLRPFVRDHETSVRIGLRGGPGSCNIVSACQ